MQKMITFYQDIEIDRLKLAWTLPNLATNCQHKSTDKKIHPITEACRDLAEKFRENVVGGPSIIFTRKASVVETFIRKSTIICKSYVGLDAIQQNPYSMYQPMPTGLYTRWDLDPETNWFTPWQNKTRRSEKRSWLNFKGQNKIAKPRAFIY